MPVRKVGRKWKMGSRTFGSKVKAERAYRAYRAKKHERSK